MFSELIMNSPNKVYMIQFISVDQDVIKVDDHKNVLFFYHDLADVALKVS